MARGDRSRGVSIRLSVKDADVVRQSLERLGERGQRALKKIETSAQQPGAHLRALSAASASARGELTRFSGVAGGVGVALTALGPGGFAAAAGIGAGVLVAKQLADGIRSAVAEVDQLANTATKIGVSVEGLQELRHVFEQSGVSVQTLEMGLQRLGRRMGTIATFGKGEAKPAFDELGISVTHAAGRLKTVEEVLPEIADAMARVTDQGRKLSLMQKLVDSEGVAMVVALQKGAAALDASREAARRLGIVLDEDTARNASKAKEQLTDLERVVDVQLNQALVDLAPLLVSVAEGWAAVARWAGSAWSAMGGGGGPARSVEDISAELSAARRSLARRRELSSPFRGMFGANEFASAEEEILGLEGQLDARGFMDERNAAAAVAKEAAEAEERAAIAAHRRGEATAKIVAGLERELALSRLTSEARAETKAIDEAVAKLKKESPEASLEEIARVKALVAERFRVAAARKVEAAGEKEYAKALKQSAEEFATFRAGQAEGREAIAAQIEGIEREAELIGMSALERAKAGEVLRAENKAREKGIELTNSQREALGEAVEAREKARKAADALKEAERRAAEEAKRSAEMMVAPFKNALAGIHSAFSGAFVDLFSGSIDTARDAAAAIKGVFIRLAAEVATLAIFQPAAGAALSAVGLGNIASGLGLAGGGGGGGAGGGGGGGASGLSFAVGGASLARGFQSQTLGNFGVKAASSLGFGAQGQAFLGNAGLNAPIGAIGSILASMLGLGDGGIGGMVLGTAGGLAGAGIGATLGSLGGPIGAMVGSFIGTALSGLLGRGARGHPSADTRVDIDLAAGRLNRGPTSAGGGDADLTEQMADAAASILNEFAERLGVGIAGVPGTGSSRLLSFGEFRGKLHAGVHGGEDLSFGAADEAVRSAVLRVLSNPALFEGLSENVARAMVNSTATTVEDFLADIDLAAGLDAFLGGLAENVADLTGGLSSFGEEVNPASEALEALNARFDELTESAAGLGLELGQIETGRGDALALLRGGFDRQIADAILAITDPDGLALAALARLQDARLEAARELGADLVEVERLNLLERQELLGEAATVEAGLIEGVTVTAARAFRGLATTIEEAILGIRVGDLSALSPVEQLDVARTAFGSLETAALAGDQDALAGLPGAGRRVLEAARRQFASSPEFATEFDRVLAVLEAARAFSDAQATGGGFAFGGMPPIGSFSVVGEGGPELAFFGSPASVFSAEQSRRLLDRAANDNGGAVVAAVGQQTEALLAAIAMLERRIEGLEREVRQQTQAAVYG